MPTCDRILEILAAHQIDGATGLAAEVREHLAGCPQCSKAAAELESLWADLGGLPTPEPAPDAAARFERAANSLRRRSVMIDKPVLTAALVATLLAGAGIAQLLHRFHGSVSVSVSSAPDSSRAAADTTQPEFLLLIRESGDHPLGHPAELVEEYRRWAGSLASRGKLVSAEKLRDGDGLIFSAGSSGIAIKPQDRSDPSGRIGGYFIFRARDRGEAEAVARECPGLKHGSVIELRQIDPT